MTELKADSKAKLDEEWDALLFGVRRSIRYHLHRRKFFERLGAWTNFLVIVSGGTVVALAISDGDKKSMPTIISGAIIAILSSFDLVIGFSTKARDHHDLVKHFSALEREMTKADDHRTKQNYATFVNDRLTIEEDEPPMHRVLNMYCHNELARGMGVAQGELADIHLLQSVFKEWFDLCPNSIQKFNSKPKWVAKEKARLQAEAAAKQSIVPAGKPAEIRV
jgi:hypothetical protein